ncbi:GNAT family N-acetyltransferase [Streptomyces sp. NBC_00513]|uniref:GNAT family N-acetyltransferase n=1 Tax=unclassified Streptomyces TaxID=2593676 RepID=UPI00225BD3CC|nr:GNAT family N-acetyltransferase [Streptomyces sp. NBC_00424]MCX5076405.1 GNAT family N-acetyltransferase [Streptomyces sp. NBC_00424]WUD40558.1 GNAT family N-acetyltransferase [Streptomyces sp. NBC_00513]
MPHVLVRPLDLTDDPTAAAVHRVGRAAYAVEAALIGFDGIPALREGLDEMRERPLRWIGAVARDDVIAGFLAWEDTKDGGVCVDRLCVDPAWFRRGIASLLCARLPADRPVTVTTGVANAPAVALYERLGFLRGEDFEPVPGLRMASFSRNPASLTPSTR